MRILLQQLLLDDSNQTISTLVIQEVFIKTKIISVAKDMDQLDSCHQCKQANE